jgi:anti-sigma factor RsiW
MNVTEDVINDLLPLYYSDEASADTRAMVDAYFQANPAFARTARAAREEVRVIVNDLASDVSAERAVIDRTRKVVKRRSWTLALALFFTLVPFTVGSFDDGKTFFMLRDVPVSRWLWVAAGWLWFEYVRLNRRLRVL